MSAGIPLASITRLVLRELDTLKAQIEAYPRDEDLWLTVPGIANPGGNLALHLCGNLQHYIGARLGGSGYRRDRPAEFSDRHVPRDEILRRIGATRTAVETTLNALDPSVLTSAYPEEIAGVTLDTAQFLAHLASHLAYHLGQIDYHRRMSTGAPSVVGALSVKPLVSSSG